MLFFWFFKNCELIKDSSLWSSNFIPLVHDSIIIIGSRFVTYTFGLCFTCKHWVRVFYQNLNFSFLGQVFQYFCWVSKRVYWSLHHLVSEHRLKLVFYPFYLLFPIILSCSFCVLYSLFLFCDVHLVKIMHQAPNKKKTSEKK